MKIIAKCDCGINGEYYGQGEEIKDLTFEQILKLNEMGFIEPLDFKELMLIKKEINKPKQSLEKEE